MKAARRLFLAGLLLGLALSGCSGSTEVDERPGEPSPADVESTAELPVADEAATAAETEVPVADEAANGAETEAPAVDEAPAAEEEAATADDERGASNEGAETTAAGPSAPVNPTTLVPLAGCEATCAEVCAGARRLDCRRRSPVGKHLAFECSKCSKTCAQGRLPNYIAGCLKKADGCSAYRRCYEEYEPGGLDEDGS